MAPKRKIHLNFFEMAYNNAHMGLGMWKLPQDSQPTKDSLEYYIWLAKLAEKGKITGIFFADVYGVDDTFPGQFKAQFKAGANCAQMDPIVFVSAMASVTKSLCFGITGSTSYIKPFVLARTYSTLDHATKGRIAWNIVTSYSTSSAKANGNDKITAHDKRYEKAHEYLDLVRYHQYFVETQDVSLINEGCGKALGKTTPKFHRVTFLGNHHKTAAVGACHPSPQRTPVLFQAGQSTAGKAFAAANAEAVFVGGGKPSDTAPYVKELRAAAASHGRDPNHVKVFPQMTPILGRTVEEAQAKYEKYKAMADWEGGIANPSQYLYVDLSAYPVDEPFDVNSVGKSDNAVHAIINTLKRYADQVVTPRILGENMAFCGFGPMPVGTPEMVADVMEDWANNADIDGFNIAYVSNPESYEDLVELLVPVLQKRGLMWDDYTVPGGTYRENLLGTPGQPGVPEGHPARQFRYDNLKEKYADENGDITIDRRNAAQEPEVETIITTLNDTTLNEQPTLVKASA
ncbi:bacterial luciferase-like protein [Mollisia scopiformis]|uniref:Bacterial luciferase-like protein n=1 Tax=Mollisia scopiformis TaxID=149040 RepID=A0A132B9I3_MOLSC|nr:bacterial luciferase-like protein [Mollisia scopiformis]KUJ08659.1 bacterial luciferase-like protein [Mollisia scopiformis]